MDDKLKAKLLFEISQIDKLLLEEYLKFRHFVRHAYGFQLEWTRMENLIIGITTFWQTIKENVNEFILS